MALLKAETSNFVQKRLALYRNDYFSIPELVKQDQETLLCNGSSHLEVLPCCWLSGSVAGFMAVLLAICQS